MLLIVAFLVAILFGGLTFVAHIVWFGLVAGLVVAVAVHVSKGLTRGA
jgi:hypothetical protein